MTTTWENIEKSGTMLGGWNYDELGITYDMIIDLDTGNTVFYDGLGVSQTWTNQTPKATTTFTNQTPKATTVFINLPKI